MKLFALAALAIFASAAAEIDHDYAVMTDGNGVPHVIDLAEKLDISEADLERASSTVSFNLYTRSQPDYPEVFVYDVPHTVSTSNFRKNRPTRFIVHGWSSDQWSDACASPRDAYLRAGDYNVIVVDWSSIANLVYSAAAGNVPKIAERVTEMLNYLKAEFGLNFSTTQLVGHSLGAHVAGLAARAANGKIQAVVGLDPAGPGFENAGASKRIDSSDASNVQIIHTNGGKLGLLPALGHIDFYPNGGESQPGCGTDLTGACSHGRSYEYFAESIKNPTGFRAAANVYMGGTSLTNGRGSYRFNTRSKAPYAMG